MIVLSLPNFVKREDIRSVYSGRAGSCCCGCSGNHRYASAFVEEAGKHRGYPVAEDEISDRTVSFVVNKINGHVNEIGIDDVEIVSGSHVALTVGNRLYLAYFRKE